MSFKLCAFMNSVLRPYTILLHPSGTYAILLSNISKQQLTPAH